MDKGFKELIKPKDTEEKDMPMPGHMSPMLCLDSEQMPDVKGWKLGQEYNVKVRMTRRSEDDKGKVNADFEVIGVEGKDTEEQKAENGDESKTDNDSMESED